MSSPKTPPGSELTDAASETRAHYQRHPYPAGATLDWSPWELQRINYLTGRERDAPLGPDARVLVAGCGTREAVLWALALPEADVVGVDFSAASLKRASRTMAALSLDNVTLARADLMDLTEQEVGGDFELIVSYGVVHHLDDPAQGLARLTRLLRPDGVMKLMLYSTTHRAPVRQLDDIATRLSPAGASAEDRVEKLVALARNTAEFPGPLREALTMVVEQADGDRAALMDTFGHPSYTTYSIHELWSLLRSAELRFNSWAQPGQWRADSYLEPGPVADGLAGLPPQERYDIIDRLFSPLFVFYAERADRPDVHAVLPYEVADHALLDRVVRVAHRMRIEFDSTGQPGDAQPYSPTVRRSEHGVEVSFLPGATYQEHLLLIPLLQQIDGVRTVREAAAAAAERSKAPIHVMNALAARAVRALISPHEALVVVS